MINSNVMPKAQNDVYVIDMGVTRNPAVSVDITQNPAAILHGSVLLPTAQIINYAITEQEKMSKDLAAAILGAYAAGLWPDSLREEDIASLKLTSLHKLLQGRDKRFFMEDDSFEMLQSMHTRFLTCAIEVMQLTRAGNVEAAYELLTTQYARNNRQVLWLLNNLKRSISSVKFERRLTAA